jgi:hypothetical protein
VGFAGEVDDGIDVPAVQGVEFIPGNKFRIVAVQFSPKRITSHGVNRWTLSHQLKKVGGNEPVFSCGCQGAGKVGADKTEGAGDKDVQLLQLIIIN